MLRCLALLAVGEKAHHVLDLFRAIAMRHQQGIGRIDDEQVARPQRHHRSGWRMDESPGRADRKAHAVDAVAVHIGRVQRSNGVPASDIAPHTLERHHCNAGTCFEHCVIDTLAAAVFERASFDPDEMTIDLGAGRRLATGFQDVGRVLRQRGNQRAGLHQEYSAVPQMTAFEQELLCFHRRRLFDEGSNPARCVPTCCIVQRLTLADVAIGCTGKRRYHAEGDDPAGACRRNASQNRRGEVFCVRNVVIGRCKKQQCLGSTQQGCQGHGRSRVAPHRFQQLPAMDAGGFHAFLDQETVRLGRDARDFRIQQLQPFQCQVQQALLPDQWSELLGQSLAGQRPQAGAVATAQHHRMDGDHREPSAVITVLMVLSKILKSSQSDQLST